jgi:3-hydroxyacyl-CoA dehydrogenase
MDAVSYNIINNVALLGCKNGPVNALGYPLRLGLKKGFERAIKDQQIDVIIIYGEGKTFPAGADISEFATGMVNKLNLNTIFKEFENSSKPLVAACHGTCFGGGCELALCCHYRVGTERSKYGFPEVKLGLLPGAGGTQRLPRLVGPFIALEMCTKGDPISAQKAEQIGLIDQIINVNQHRSEVRILKERAIIFAQTIAGKTFAHLKVSKMFCETMDDFFFEQAKNMALKKKMLAPAKIVDIIRASAKMSFEKGKKLESKGFYELAMGSQARALQQTFFAQRAVSKIPGIDINRQAFSVKRVGIIGSGLMGGGISMCFAQKGIKVILKDIKQEFLDKGLKMILSNWKRSSMKGKWSPYQVKEMIKLIKPTLNYDDLMDVDLVIEAAFENMNIKKNIFTSLDKVCKLDCILATNTSTLDIDEIAKTTSRPDKV